MHVRSTNNGDQGSATQEQDPRPNQKPTLTQSDCQNNRKMAKDGWIHLLLRTHNTSERLYQPHRAAEGTLGLSKLDAVPTGHEQRQEFQKRLDTLQSECSSTYNEQGHVDSVYIQDNSRLAYCSVAKIGCTFWKRVFLFLNDDTGSHNVTSPFGIPRMFVHYGKKLHTSIVHEMGAKYDNYTRFLFSRDPFSRLWSAYLDKYYLPDFWVRKDIMGTLAARRDSVSEEASRCHNDVTFQEFLEYVVSHHPREMNGHWQPIKHRCDPCQFKPNILGKQETFTDDATFILQGVGQGWMIESFDYDAYVREELSMLIDYNFSLIKRMFYQRCINDTGLMHLLWRVFQLNGYLPNYIDAGAVVQKLRVATSYKQAFEEYVLNTYSSAPRTERRKWKAQRQDAIKAAYRTIPQAILDSIRFYYRDDFRLFGYDGIPPGQTPFSTDTRQ